MVKASSGILRQIAAVTGYFLTTVGRGKKQQQSWLVFVMLTVQKAGLEFLLAGKTNSKQKKQNEK